MLSKFNEIETIVTEAKHASNQVKTMMRNTDLRMVVFRTGWKVRSEQLGCGATIWGFPDLIG